MWNRGKYRLERWLQRGAVHQLLLIAALVAGVALLGGGLALLIGGVFGGFGEAAWWAFLRLTDPGYLGDDEGLLLRVLATSVTILGYVLFMGSLIAIMTQWLGSTLRTLEAGLTPIALEGHLLILGWTNRTPEVVHEIVLAEGRLQRFLQRSGLRRLRIVILAQQLSSELRLELKTQLGPHWDERQIVFRSGSSLRFEHLERVNALKAALIIVPGANFVMGGAAATDARVVKTIMSLVSYGHTANAQDFPPIVAEIFDLQTATVTRNVYPGPIELIPSDTFISRLLVQNVRHEGLSHIYSELLSHRFGNEVYVRSIPEFADTPWSEVATRFDRAVPLGIVRPQGDIFRPILNPPADLQLEHEDRIVFVASSFEETQPGAVRPARERSRAAEGVPVAARAPGTVRRKRLLVLGWNHLIGSLLLEFSRHGGERFDIDLLSLVPTQEREAALARTAIDASRVQIRQLDGDYTRAEDLQRLEPASYDTVLILGSDWLESDTASDARTILGYVQLRALLPDPSAGPKILVELLDPENERLFVERLGEVIVSPLLLSHMLAHVALRPELGAVFDELFGPSSTEIVFRSADRYGLTGAAVTVEDAQRQAALRGEIALGFRQHPKDGAGSLTLNPPGDRRWELSAGDEVVVLTTHAPAECGDDPTPTAN